MSEYIEVLWSVTKGLRNVGDEEVSGTISSEEIEARARLIAAAPALYDVAKLLDSLDWVAGYEIGHNNSLILDKALDAARAALAEVDGK